MYLLCLWTKPLGYRLQRGRSVDAGLDSGPGGGVALWDCLYDGVAPLDCLYDGLEDGLAPRDCLNVGL